MATRILSSGRTTTSENFYSTERGNNFLSFLREESFCDVLLQFQDGKQYKAHRLILSYVSSYFRDLFSKFPSQSTFLFVEEKDPEGMFGNLLEYIYKGDETAENFIIKDTATAIPLLTLAQVFRVESLYQIISSLLYRSIRMSNVASLLNQAINHDNQEIIQRSIHILAKHFRYINPSELFPLPYSIFLTIIKYDPLNVKEEYQLYLTVSQYISHHSSGGQELSEEQMSELYKHIRYRYMTYKQLEEVVKNPLVPKDILVEAGMIRLAQWESPGWSPSVILPRLKTRPGVSITIDYKGETGDDIIQWIATNCGREPWQDPVLRGVKVTASSVERGNPSDLVRKKAGTEMWTMDIPSSYFTIDFGQGRSLIPTYYTLMHGGNYSYDILRTWQFQGMEEGEENWTTLVKHNNDTSLSGRFVPYSWPIGPFPKAFRYFRILQTGHNSSNRNFLVLSGFEIYGELFED